MGRHDEQNEQSCSKCKKHDKKCPNEECRCQSLISFNQAVTTMFASLPAEIARQPEAAPIILAAYYTSVSTLACANCIEIDSCCVWKNSKTFDELTKVIRSDLYVPK